jgi:hypothetical protein
MFFNTLERLQDGMKTGSARRTSFRRLFGG